jgi:TolB-like protein/tetratricopeptide (TPR) repeat protein
VIDGQKKTKKLSFGKFAFDLESGDLYGCGKCIALQPQTVELLRCLLERPGEIATRATLRNRLWPPRTVVDFDAGLNAAVKKLRGVLGDPPNRSRFIQTVPRRGYRFIGISAASSRRNYVDSLAVLPFAVTTGQANMEYLSEGIAERLINELSEECGFSKVIARNSAFRYAGSDPKEIGAALGVSAVLTGQLRISKLAVSLTVELTDTAEATHLWGATIDRRLTDLPQLQLALTNEICAALRASLPTKRASRPRQTRIKNFDVYRLYLQGRYAWGKHTPAGMEEAIECFEKAIELDSGFSLAHAGLSDCYNSLASWESGAIAPRIGFEKARQLALRAMQLDRRSADAHTSLGYTHLHYSWNWGRAELEFRKALAINPHSTNARHWYSHLLGALGRTDESLAESRTLIELDPFDLINNVHMSWHHYMARDFSTAVREAQRTLLMEKRFPWGYFFTGLALDAAGDHRDAARQFRKGLELAGQNTVMLSALGHAFGCGHMYDSAREIMVQLYDLSKSRYVSSYELALIHLALGENDKALDRVGAAVAERSGWLPYFQNDARLDPIRTDPKFAKLTAHVGLLPAKPVSQSNYVNRAERADSGLRSRQSRRTAVGH